VYLEGLWEEVVSGAVSKYYTLNGDPVALRTHSGGASTLTYLHGDHLGSVSVTTTASQGVASQQEFDPWGKVRSGGVSQTPRNYTGQLLDATGLLYYNARYYDPALGRFLSADVLVPGENGMDGVAYTPLTVGFQKPAFLTALHTETGAPFWFHRDDAQRAELGESFGPHNPQALNRYAYVLNNPLKYTDPTGHCPWCRALLSILRAIGQQLSKFGRWIGDRFRPNPSVMTGSNQAGSAIVSSIKIGQKSLQHAFSQKHAKDFGITGNWNKANAALLEKALANHMTSSGTIIIKGTYRGNQPVYHFYNPSTGLWSITDLQGNFIAAWRLYPSQVKDLLTNSNVT
jgi:RHS repeat-associated protein